MRRYGVNTFVAHEDGDGAPVVVETNPSYQSLFGRIEFESVFGAVATDHGHLQRRRGPPRQRRLSGAAHAGGPLASAGVEQAQGGAAHRPRPAREPGRAVHAVPHRHADPRAHRPRRQGRAGGHPGRPPAAVRARRGRSASCSGARRIRRRHAVERRPRARVRGLRRRPRARGRPAPLRRRGRRARRRARRARRERPAQAHHTFDGIAELVRRGEPLGGDGGPRGGRRGPTSSEAIARRICRSNLVEERIARAHRRRHAPDRRGRRARGPGQRPLRHRARRLRLRPSERGSPRRPRSDAASVLEHRPRDRARRADPRQGVPHRCAATSAAALRRRGPLALSASVAFEQSYAGVEGDCASAPSSTRCSRASPGCRCARASP